MIRWLLHAYERLGNIQLYFLDASLSRLPPTCPPFCHLFLLSFLFSYQSSFLFPISSKETREEKKSMDEAFRIFLFTFLQFLGRGWHVRNLSSVLSKAKEDHDVVESLGHTQTHTYIPVSDT